MNNQTIINTVLFLESSGKMGQIQNHFFWYVFTNIWWVIEELHRHSRKEAANWNGVHEGE